jgi:large subunit ribosomal protein L24
MRKIRKEDEVIIITGKDKGKRGKVMRVLGDKIIVGGINVVKKHTKPNPHNGVQGGIVPKEMPIEISNVAIFNPQTNKPDRIGFRFNDSGAKVRFFKSTNEAL